MAEKETKEKPLDKMTVKDLREIAKEIPEITGVHGMNKAELLDAIEKVKGIVETPKEKAETPKEKVETPKEKVETPKKKVEAPKEKAETPKEKVETPKKKVEAPKEKKDRSVKDIKSKIRAFKAERKTALEAKDKKMATIYRRRISRLKKKTRRAA
ncbi:MAG: Rho termination factor N-terminal domain-containing protein [Deltaproteobacteria bacterium]|nr:Rho termination factor N-terminal domain-containing protein [Deltaproteobacteria bacterium]